ncbi:site-2 protease family protein [Candidatus Synchoanobacter obligatus]|uniref:Site-2 protease family protein n=1 Tax=Candidatus Synchoanobacter obligatus TaxID=2919597 RepID=A0ABT1L564_9GAMM|nr:site-2 protease family protein [Candidatus Synchoanobacter obligatus]MCP8352008.1 site-2 protease family protein [Candidatus Synchoanobacter obligatus]
MTSTYPWIINIFVWFLPVLTAISWREAIKAWVCHYRGDSTAKMAGLGSFSLMKNLDPIGSALAPFVLIIRHIGFIYAWAKPLDIRPNYLNRGTFDVGLIVFAGIASNFIMAIGWAWIGYIGQHFILNPNAAKYVTMAGKSGVSINLLLFLIHMIPLPPLDMSQLVRFYLPRYIKAFYITVDSIGHYLIFVIIFLKLEEPYLMPIMKALTDYLYSIVGFSL